MVTSQGATEVVGRGNEGKDLCSNLEGISAGDAA